MATFPSIQPTYGTTKRSAPNVRGIQFGSGYQQRAQFGINQNPKVYDLTFEVSETDADTIETFLDARAADNAAFEWSPPDETDTYKWICKSWTKTLPYSNLATIQTTFTQVFEP